MQKTPELAGLLPSVPEGNIPAGTAVTNPVLQIQKKSLPLKLKMKFLSVILSSYVLFLTVIPSLIITRAPVKDDCNSSCCMANAAKEKSHPSSHQPKENNCKDACNPFMRCCNCYALTMEAPIFTLPFIYLNRKFIIPIETPCSDFMADTWHPPKIA